MFKLKTLRFALITFALAMVVNLALSGVTFAKHGRGRGRCRDQQSEKFINGHDARDGRWDGRGPRFRDRRDRDDWFRFRDRRDRDEFRRAQWRRDELRRAEFRREQWRRAEMRRAEWRRNELLRRRVLPRRRF